jgi:hypothetical protein
VLIDGNRGDKPISSPRDSFDKAWIVGIVVDSGTQLLQNDIKTRIEVNVRAFWPKCSVQFLTRDGFAGVLQ